MSTIWHKLAQFITFKTFGKYNAINLILDTITIDINKKYNIQNFEHNIRCIQDFTIKYTSSNKILFDDYNEERIYHEYKSVIDLNFLSQGIIVNLPISSLINIKLKINDDYYALDYNIDLINIYGEIIGDGLTYFGFNVCENFKSLNVVGCLKLYKAKLVNIIIISMEKTDQIKIYVPNWNIIIYNREKVVLKYY